MGESKHVELLNSIQHLCELDVVASHKIKYLSVLRILLEFQSEKVVATLLVEGEEWSDKWFSHIIPQKKDMQKPGRLFWLSCTAVTLHACRSSTFDLLSIK